MPVWNSVARASDASNRWVNAMTLSLSAFMVSSMRPNADISNAGAGVEVDGSAMGSISYAGVNNKVGNTQLEPPPMRVTSTAVLVGTTQYVPRQQILSQNGYG